MESTRSPERADSGDSAPRLIEHLLAVARERLGMELSWVSSFDETSQTFDHVGGDEDAFAIHPGDSTPLEASYCLRVVDGRLPNIVADTTQNETTAGLDATEALGLGSYISVPIEVAGSVVGMLCCVSRGPSPHLSDEDVKTLELIAPLIAEILTTESPKRRRDRMVAERISAAIANSELTAVFQPIVAIDTGVIVGVEALTRFSEPPSRPDVWFEEAASVGLGVELELAAINNALTQLSHLPSTQFMTLNASPATIEDPRLAEVLSQSEPERLIVEVTEHTAIEDSKALGHSLQLLRQIGVRIAVDDVGAGFASLACVLELQPTILKIDRSIVRGVHSDPARHTLAQAIMGVANRLGATVVAEGVEVTEELNTLAALGVDHAQGFLLGRPQASFLDCSPVAISAAPPSGLPLKTTAIDQDLAIRRFELAMLHSPVGMALVSINGSFIHVNPAFATMQGRRIRDFDELGFQEITHPDDLPEGRRLIEKCLSGEGDDCRVEMRYQRPDGSTLWGDVSVVLVRSSDQQPLYFIAQVQDTSDRHRREDLLTTRATTDHLTAVANRSSAGERLDRLVATSTPFGVLYCDLRNFKAVNDSHGHSAGDHVLVAVAQRLKQVVRSGDQVSRWGGDEFLIIVADATEASLRKLSKRVTEAVAHPVSLHPGTSTTTPTITVGSALFDPTTGDTVDGVLHRADSHMYQQRQGATSPSPAN